MDRATSLVLLILSALGYWHTDTFPEVARIFPSVILGGIFILSAVLFFTSGRHRAKPGAEDSFHLGKWFGIAAISAAYIGVLNSLGYTLATALYLLCAMVALGERRTTVLLVVAVLFSVAPYYIFTFGLSMALPMGLFGWRLP